MPEMDFTTQAAQAALAANAARAAEARMRSEGTNVASPEGMEMEDQMEEMDADEAPEEEGPVDDLPNASLESVPDISPEEEAALHGADSAPAALAGGADDDSSSEGASAPAEGSDASSSSDGDQTAAGSADGTEVHDAGLKTS